MPLTRGTNYLNALRVQNTPNDPDFCSKLFVEEGEELAENQKIKMSTLRKIRYAIWRRAVDLQAVPGTSGEVYQGTTVINIGDVHTFRILSVDGDKIKLTKDDGSVFGYTIYSYKVPKSITGYTVVEVPGVLQPGDRLQFVYPSVYSEKSEAMVIKIVDANEAENWVEVQCDRSVTWAMRSQDPTNLTPSAYYVKAKSQRGHRDRYTPIVQPFWNRAVPQVRTVELVHLSAHRSYKLTDETASHCPIIDPTEGDPINGIKPTLRVRALHVSAVWVDITAIIISNLRIRVRTLPGAVPGTSSHETEIYFGDRDENEDSIAGGDLTTNHTAFSIEYYAGHPGQKDDPQWCKSGPCAHSHYDETGSIGKYNKRGTGGPDLQGRHYFCSHRYLQVSNGDPDDLVITPQQPSGLVNFPDDGHCYQLNVCDMYTTRKGSGKESFDIGLHFSRIIKELFFSVRARVRQGMPGLADARSWIYEVIGCHSLVSLFGGFSLTTPVGMHETSVFPDTPDETKFHYGEITKVEDEDNGDSFSLVNGLIWNPRYSYAAVEYLRPETYNAGMYGMLYRASAGYSLPWLGSRNDPIEYDSELDDDNDPMLRRRMPPPRVGWRMGADEGTLSGKGWSHYAHATPETEVLNIFADLDNKDALQDSGYEYGYGGRITVHLTPFLKFGKTVGATMELSPLRCSGQSEELGHSTTIVDIVPGDVENGYVIRLAHTEHAFSQVGGDPGNRFDVIDKWKANGGNVEVNDFERVHNFYEPNKSFGACLNKFAPGQTAKISGTFGGYAFDLLRFYVRRAEPGGWDGAASTDWDHDYRNGQAHMDGFYPGPSGTLFDTLKAFLTLGIDSITGTEKFDRIAYPTLVSPFALNSTDTIFIFNPPNWPIGTGALLKNKRTGEVVRILSPVLYGAGMYCPSVERGVYGTAQPVFVNDEFEWVLVANSVTNQPFEVLTTENDTRPALTAGQCWHEVRTNYIHFSTSDSATGVRIRCTRLGAEGATSASAYLMSEVFTIPAKSKCVTTMSWSDWSAAVAKSVKYASGTSLTETEADPPTAGQFDADDLSGNLVLYGNLVESGKILAVNLDMGATKVAAPGSIQVKAQQYTARAQRYDEIEIIDETGFLAAAGLHAFNGATITSVFHAAPMIPGENSLKAQPFNGDEENVTDLLSEHGRRLIYIEQSVIASLRTQNRYVRFEATVMRSDERARVSKDIYDALITGTDAANVNLFSFVNSGPPVQPVGMYLFHNVGYRAQDYLVHHDFTNYFKLKKEAMQYERGLVGSNLFRPRSFACQIRYWGRLMCDDTTKLTAFSAGGTAYANVNHTDAADCRYGSFESPRLFTHCPSRWKLIDGVWTQADLDNPAFMGEGVYFFSTDPMVDGDPEAHNPGGHNQFSAAEWRARNYHKPVLKDQTGAEVHGGWWGNDPISAPHSGAWDVIICHGEPSVLAGSDVSWDEGLGFNHPAYDDVCGLFETYPFSSPGWDQAGAWMQGFPQFFSGCGEFGQVFTPAGTMLHGKPFSVIKCLPQLFNPDQWIKNIPGNTTVNSVLMTLTFTGLKHNRIHCLRTIDGDGTNHLFDVIDGTNVPKMHTDQKDVSLILMAAYLDARGNTRLTPIATTPPLDFTNGKPVIVTATNLLKALLAYRDVYPHHAFCIIPAAANAAIEASDDPDAGRDILAAMLPDNSYAVFTNVPRPDPDLHPEARYNEYDYIQSSKAGNVTWSGLTVTLCKADTTYPDAMATWGLVEGNWPAMVDLPEE